MSPRPSGPAADLVSSALQRSLRVRGFYGGPRRFVRVRGEGCDVVTVEESVGRGGSLEVRIVLGRGDVSATGPAPAVSVWDLMPAREPGGAWRISATTRPDAVARDLVEAVERYGLPRLEPAEPAERTGGIERP